MQRVIAILVFALQLLTFWRLLIIRRMTVAVFLLFSPGQLVLLVVMVSLVRHSRVIHVGRGRRVRGIVHSDGLLNFLNNRHSRLLGRLGNLRLLFGNLGLLVLVRLMMVVMIMMAFVAARLLVLMQVVRVMLILVVMRMLMTMAVVVMMRLLVFVSDRSK